MRVKMELHLPDLFFDSAKQINGYESLSEQISKAILTDILHIKNVERGDEKKHEPDYISAGQGYEVTFGLRNNLIPMLRGRTPLNSSPYNQEQELINFIKESLIRKSKKTYSVRSTLIIFTLTPLLEWYSYFYLKDMPTYYFWEFVQNNRNELFQEIIQEFIGTQKPFDNVLIIQPTHDEHYILYDVKEFGNNNNFMTLIGIVEAEKAVFPRYKLISCENGSPPITYETSVVLYRNEALTDGQTKI